MKKHIATLASAMLLAAAALLGGSAHGASSLRLTATVTIQADISIAWSDGTTDPLSCGLLNQAVGSTCTLGSANGVLGVKNMSLTSTPAWVTATKSATGVTLGPAPDVDTYAATCSLDGGVIIQGGEIHDLVVTIKTPTAITRDSSGTIGFEITVTTVP